MVFTITLTAVSVACFVFGLYRSVANPVRFVILWRSGTLRDSSSHLVVATMCKYLAWQVLSAAAVLCGLRLVAERMWPTEVETITFWMGTLVFVGLAIYAVGVFSEKPPWSRQ